MERIRDHLRNLRVLFCGIFLGIRVDFAGVFLHSGIQVIRRWRVGDATFGMTARKELREDLFWACFSGTKRMLHPVNV